MGIENDTGVWSLEWDVVVVGSGACGLTAGIAAAQGGVEVLVVEKEERPLSNTSRSSGMIPAAGTRFQREAGIIETPERMAEDIFRKNKNGSDPEMTLHLCRTATRLVEWLVDEVGVSLTFVADFKYPGMSQFRMHAPPARTGADLADDLRQTLKRQPGAELVQGAVVTDLVTNNDGVVCGVVVERRGKPERIRAKKVILACNGFGANTNMVRKYCPEIAGALYFGGEGSTGEGILWGKDLGAALAFMDAYQGYAAVAVPHGIVIPYAVITEGGFMVNSEGWRFGDEGCGYSEHALSVIQQPGGIAFEIYDVHMDMIARNFADYQNAVEAGAIKSAANIEELSEVLGLSPTTLEHSLDEYNKVAAGIAVDPFGRLDCRHLEPPFFGVRVTGALFHTQGGLRVDKDACVLRKDGSPIPNLYAGGGVAAGLSGHGAAGYLAGNGLLTALGYGMLAGRHAALTIKEGR